uniref:Replication protein E1 n=1 Tax=Human papillomavirus TaxID=10566 RepID=A0A386H7A2_9PAPI|nr:MAG: E1 protein [Human papillomavirus]
MGDHDKGTKFALEGASHWFIEEAECLDSLESIEDLFEGSTDGSDISNLLDDAECNQGNSLALFNEKVTEDCNYAITALKRKYVRSPEQSISELSPRLEAIRISPQKNIKRRLFEDSGIAEDEVENSVERVGKSTEIVGGVSTDSTNSYVENLNLLNSSNYKIILYSKCKDKYGMSFAELTRTFKSDRTCAENWIVYAHNIRTELLEASKIHLQTHCEFVQLIEIDFDGLFCLLFKSAKNRETVTKLFCNLLSCSGNQLLSDPPRIRSPPVAIYFYQRAFGSACFKHGDFPNWIKKQTLLSHESAATSDTFDLSQMIQFAYDNNLTDEPSIAYKYAMQADHDPNAAAFLKHNSQAKFVRDTCSMVRYYKRHEMKELSMSAWIWKCCSECGEDGDWKVIAKFFKYQQVNLVSFLTALRSFLKGIPKKQCLVFYGPSDTGKSYFCNSLIQFVKGRVISIMNKSSTFWLQPLLEGKMGFLDDCTISGWYYLDSNMRGALDGNYVCIDSKHKAPAQIKLPPMLITTNVYLEEDESLKYLRSRLQLFHFPHKFPLTEDGSVVYEITNETWKSFFRKLAIQIDLTPPEDLQDESGRFDKALRCTAGQNNDFV